VDHLESNGRKPHKNFLIFFKFTCRVCGEDVTFNEPFKLYEKGECCKCGYENEVIEGGFELEIFNKE
jgi:hypothetical protein